MTDAGMRQHIALEALETRRAVRPRHQMRARNGIPANSFVDDGAGKRAHQRQALSEDIFPTVVSIQSRASSIRDRLSEPDDRGCRRCGLHIAVFQPKYCRGLAGKLLAAFS